ncbi:conserved hypothetical protein [Bacillus vallismortis]
MDERKKHTVILHGTRQKIGVCFHVDEAQNNKMRDYFIIHQWNSSKLK